MNIGEEGIAGGLEFRVMGKGFYLFVPNQAKVSLSLYDVSGKLVQGLYNGVLSPGGHTFIPTTKTKGVYLVVLMYSVGMKTLKIVR